MSSGQELAIIIISGAIATILIMFAKFRFHKAEVKDTREEANVSVEIVKEVTGKKNKPVMPLQDVEIQYPVKDLWRGPLCTRGRWMEGKREYFRFSQEEMDERGVTPIRLEGWVEERTYHHLLVHYGDLFTTRVNWDGWVVTLNIVACQSGIPVEDMPRVVETGTGVAFTVSAEVFRYYVENARAEVEKGEVAVGRKLILHCIVDRAAVASDFNAESFNDWPAGMVNDLIAMRRPGESYQVFSPEELGLVAPEAEEEEEEGAKSGEGLLQEVEAEPTKSGAKPTLVDEELGGSPRLADKSRRETLHDVDLVDRSRMLKRRRRRRNKGRRFLRNNRSPVRLTKEQELWIVSQLVLGVEPEATEERIRANYEEILRKREEAMGHTCGGPPYQYGSAHGGWNLSASDREDIEKLGKRSESSSPLPPLIKTSPSSVMSPRGELSQNLGSAASLDTSGPASKRRRKGTEESMASSVPMSPFLAMKSSGGRAVTVSTSSSEGAGRSEPGRARVNLGDLLGSGRIQFPDDGLMSNIHLEVFEEDLVVAEDGDVSQEECGKEEDLSSEDEHVC